MLAGSSEVGGPHRIGYGVRSTRYLCALFLFLAAPVIAADDLIVVLKSREIEPYETALKSFSDSLRANGHDPRVRQYLLPADNGSANELLRDIRRQKPRLILSVGSSATSQVSKAVHDTPVVFCMVLNPVASGFVQSMNAPGNNITGAALDIPARVQFEALRSLVPSVRKVGVIYNPRETGSVVRSAARAAEEIGLELIAIPITSEDRVPEALEALEQKVDALWSVADSTAFSSGSVEFILLHTLRNKIPSDYEAVGLQCGEQAAKILGAAPPSSLPVTTPRNPTLHVNLKTAETIGLDIPPERLKGAVLVE